MFKEKASWVKLPPFEQLGIVVRDIDKAVEYYEATFGWGPFSISEISLEGCLYRGKPTDVRLVLEGESIHSEFLREKGEGLQHIRFTVDNLDDILAEWAKAGIEPVWQHSMPQIGISWAYVNTDAIGGVMAELIEIKQV